ncbi:MAG TPA: VWA domain-containing protein [Methylomirabilota bacterium]|nr:VWA domain-containing protein [Methylomirabilota bacterium]
MAGRNLANAVIKFCRLLRAEGVGVTPSESVDALRALGCLDLGDRNEVYWGLRAVLTAGPEDIPIFDRLFAEFWSLANSTPPEFLGGPVSPAESSDDSEPQGGLPQKAQVLALQEWLGEPEADTEPTGMPSVSDREAFLEKDFSTFTPDQLDEIVRLVVQIARKLASRLSRRRRPTTKRGRVDLRRTMRRNLTRGEMIDLSFRERKRQKIRLVVLCDVSGSMDLYSRFLLQFLFALQHAFGRVETFAFSTRLTHITPHLRGRSYLWALRNLRAVRDWSGGTKIGESLATFNREHGARLLDRRTIVLILSDGWDTGEPALLERELRQIRRRAGRLIWLNPLLGSSNYEPLTRGMSTALPYLDTFAPAHNLASLRNLARHLHL